MITVAILLAIFGVLLFVLLLLMERRAEVEASGSTERNNPAGREPGASASPFELVPRIFSGEDRKFIMDFRSKRLERIFRAERRRVALHWVWQTTRESQEIMRVHRLASRWRHDLNVATEAKLTFDYWLLRLMCALLGLVIGTFGPQSLDPLAGYAVKLYQRIDGAAAHTRTVNRLPATMG